MSIDIAEIQSYLRSEGFDAWLLYDFQGLNPIAQKMLPTRGIITRRWFLLIPREGEPVMLAHKIEEVAFKGIPYELRTYSGWAALEEKLKSLLVGIRKAAMEYSPRNAIPYVSRVDAGTLELVRGLGVEVCSSANLVQHFQCRWTPEQLASHKTAASFLVGLQEEMFNLVAGEIGSGRRISEYDVQQEILRRYGEAGMVSDHMPIVAIGANSALPHYEPSAEDHKEIREGELLLIDIFCRQAGEATIQADITWTAYVGRGPVPEEMLKVFSVVTAARDRGVEFISERFAAGREVHGWGVDDAVRGVITKAGFGPHFTHRTGHSLGVAVHGDGVNIDNLETKDERILEPGLGFTIEPGIYFEGEFGVRSEIDCYIGGAGVEVTTLPLQRELKALL
jgi:Xaa-Pro dipeptidase